MEWLILTLIVGAVEFFVNQDNRRQAKQDTLDIQHDQQQFESDETDEARQWQEDFYLKYQSPEALMNQYRGMGASESASIMSALGVSPSSVQSPQARSGIASGLGTGVNTMSDLLNSVTGGFNSYMQGQKANTETKWIGPVNDANIKATLGNLELHWKEFGLQEKTFYDISKPLAEMQINKTQQDIDESIARVDEINQNILFLEQKVKESQQNVEESKVRADLYGEQINTEIAKQENLGADTALKTAQTGLVESQTTGQDLENQLTLMDVELSKLTGFNVRLSWDKQAMHMLTFISKNVGDNLNEGNFTWNKVYQTIKRTLEALKSSKMYESIGRSAYQMAWDYVDNHINRGYNRDWMNYRNKSKKNVDRWMRSHFRYGF